MIKRSTEGLICLRDDLGIEYSISKLTYSVSEDGSFAYIFEPYYGVIDMLPSFLFSGISGIDLSSGDTAFIRDGIIPTFIIERAPVEDREDFWQLLSDVSTNYSDPLEWLISSNGDQHHDQMYVRRFCEDDERRAVIFDCGNDLKNSSSFSHTLLELICAGHDIDLGGFVIDDSNRKTVYEFLLWMYRNEGALPKSSGKAQVASGLRGRRRIPVDTVKSNEVFNAFRSGEMSESEAMDTLGLSRSTFYRRLREFYDREGLQNL